MALEKERYRQTDDRRSQGFFERYLSISKSLNVYETGVRLRVLNKVGKLVG